MSGSLLFIDLLKYLKSYMMIYDITDNISSYISINIDQYCIYFNPYLIHDFVKLSNIIAKIQTQL
jgi:hypothetical protein